jgi:hypothetical protein
MSHHQNAGKNHNRRIGSRSCENVVEFKYLGMTITNENLIHDEIESRLSSGNAYYKNLLSSHLLSINVKIEIYNTVILPVVLYGCETWALILREEHRLKVFENSVLRRTYGPKR